LGGRAMAYSEIFKYFLALKVPNIALAALKNAD
jgi:hypothetical protein